MAHCVLKYILKWAAAGFYVLLDNHIREDQTVLRDPTEWTRKWAALVRKSAAALRLGAASWSAVSVVHALLSSEISHILCLARPAGG